MVALPGTAPEKFEFTVRGDDVAASINAAVGKRVALSYEQHKGLPGTCFGDTDYFVTGVKVVEEAPPPAMTPLSPPVVRPPDAAPAPPAAPVPGRG